MTKSETSNETLYETLRVHVARKYFGDVSSDNIDLGPLAINCFSATFWMDVAHQDSRRGVYVKIPKIILYQKANETILPLSDDDRTLGENEYQSLLHLAHCWRHDDLNVKFVAPLDFIRDYNAIVTERFYATHLFKRFRRCDLTGHFITKRANSVHAVMSRLGEALSRFHGPSISECKFDTDSVLAKMGTYCAHLKSLGVSAGFTDSVIDRLNALRDLHVDTHCTNTLKGFEVRQVFVDKNEGVIILDPGKLKRDYREMDLVRFIVSCRILYWGGLLFVLRLVPDPSYEEAFLAGYYGDDNRNHKVLSLLTVKELLKHWTMAYTIMHVKRWPSIIKTIVKNTYVDPFYKWQISVELARMES